MDIWSVYYGDSGMSYGGSVRSTYYRDYEQFPYGTLEHSNSPNSKDSYSKVQEKWQQAKTEKEQKKDCPFCKEHKKRPLINYMRKRESRKYHESICEDEEEEEEEQEQEEKQEEQQQTQHKHQHQHQHQHHQRHQHHQHHEHHEHHHDQQQQQPDQNERELDNNQLNGNQ